jgi:hypothetical protein
MLAGAIALATLGCHRPESPPPPAGPECRDLSPTLRPELPRKRPDGPLTAAERDTILAESRARRAAWQMRHVTDYRVRVAVGCFCPWPSSPRLLEVRGGKAVALLDTTGRPAGALREPWAPYTVDGMFDFLDQATKSSDMLSVRYDSCFGYPREIRGNAWSRLPDGWFWVTATDLTPR